MTRSTRRLIAGLTLGLSTACGGAPSGPTAPTPADGPRLEAARPELAAPPTFELPVPTVVEIPRMPTVWLAERHDVPLVALHVVVPYGSAADPAGQGGLAALTAEMMEQGAGRRGALELGQAAERLGAELSVEADRDASSARLVVLAENLEPALALLGDVVGRPRFEADEWARTQPLWLAGLESRAFDPPSVAALVADAALFGAQHPYGHPVDGTVDSVRSLGLDAVKAFHARHWRRERAIIVVAGDVTREQLGEMLPRAFLEWGATGEPPPWPTAPPAPAPERRIAFVERPDSAQTVLLMVEPGPDAAGLAPLGALSNIVLGGSFTSRLNLNLREDKGYTYGARSRLPFGRGAGLSRAGASVQRAVTGPALTELRAELARMAADGPTPAEIEKARATARAADVQTRETVAGVADRLAELAGLRLSPSWDADDARARAALTTEGIRQAMPAALELLPSADASLIAVGDPAALAEALKVLTAGGAAPAVTYYDAEGRPLPGPPSAGAATPAPAAPAESAD